MIDHTNPAELRVWASSVIGMQLGIMIDLIGVDDVERIILAFVRDGFFDKTRKLLRHSEAVGASLVSAVETALEAPELHLVGPPAQVED